LGFAGELNRRADPMTTPLQPDAGKPAMHLAGRSFTPEKMAALYRKLTRKGRRRKRWQPCQDCVSGSTPSSGQGRRKGERAGYYTLLHPRRVAAGVGGNTSKSKNP
jgi:hypothetical protein